MSHNYQNPDSCRCDVCYKPLSKKIMGHKLAASPQECQRCISHKQLDPKDADTIEWLHLQAQQAALWRAVCEWLGPEPIAKVLAWPKPHGALEALQQALRAELDKEAEA